jgi:hypothetical protein
LSLGKALPDLRCEAASPRTCSGVRRVQLYGGSQDLSTKIQKFGSESIHVSLLSLKSFFRTILENGMEFAPQASRSCVLKIVERRIKNEQGYQQDA